ncbi:hypothetical protein HPO96_20980 [Kribbella sandramycini]|uniref:Uncharacterized protein n=1 Tax=Kribbella sandramycini TaxID=60450 RepID=A0A7Y4P194_9ACTN|nr:hypothetical protein [Kribbella sandramycini]MBB6566622.1 hypothetical protein [Kribbella sandramycini]NOL42723.1 hypothetical protein [Kribbella sandramycini]
MTGGFELDRRGLLKLAAAAGVLPFVPALATPAQAAAAAGCTAMPLVSGPELPIVAFWPPSMQPRFNTLARFQEMKDAGFTATLVGETDDDDMAYVHSTLSFTDQTGLKALVVNRGPRALETYQEYSRHPSVVGYRLYDEPGQDAFQQVANDSAPLRAAAPGLLPYVNLLPDMGGAPWMPSGWRAYLQDFVRIFRPPLLSYDRYPLFLDRDHPAYFAEWQEMRAAGLGAGLPTWIHILSVKHFHYRMPTAAELAWQVNVSLAYGCKGIQYFCYWSPGQRPDGLYEQALFDYDGNRTHLYDAAKTLHANWLAPAGAELKPLVSESVTHANGSRPSGTIPFGPDKYLTGTSGSPVILSRFRSKDRKPLTRWLLVANPSHSAATQATLNVDTTRVTAVSRFDPATRTYQSQPSPASITVALAPGAAALYRLDAPGAALDPQVQLVLVAGGTTYHAIQQADGSWNGPNLLGDPARLVAASEFNGALNLMEIDGDVIHHQLRSVDGSWAGRNLYGGLGAVSSITSAVVVGCLQVAFAAGGVVYHTMGFPDGRWDGPNRIGNNARLVAAAERNSSFEMLQVDGSHIYHRVRLPDGNWTPRNLFATLDGITSLAVATVNEDLMVVIAAAGQLYYAIGRSNGTWQFPTPTNDPADQVAASAVNGELLITAITAGQPYTRRRRSDGTLTPRSNLPTTLTDITALTTTGRSPELCP